MNPHTAVATRSTTSPAERVNGVPVAAARPQDRQLIDRLLDAPDCQPLFDVEALANAWINMDFFSPIIPEDIRRPALLTTEQVIERRRKKLAKRYLFILAAAAVGASLAIFQQSWLACVAVAACLAGTYAAFSGGRQFGEMDGFRFGLARAALLTRWHLEDLDESARSVVDRRHEEDPRWRQSVRTVLAVPGAGYVYAALLSTGVIKVGLSTDVRRRLGEHRREAGVFGVSIVDAWISQPHLNYRQNETRLIRYCRVNGTRAKNEYFQGLDFAAVVDFARSLALTLPEAN